MNAALEIVGFMVFAIAWAVLMWCDILGIQL